jgi:hypothetical protein
MDVASSSFDEYSAVFGGANNLERGLNNATEQYSPKLIGVASTCLSETIGDDLPMIVKQSPGQCGQSGFHPTGPPDRLDPQLPWDPRNRFPAGDSGDRPETGPGRRTAS